VTARKKFIEVALPLEAINVASAREKSTRHGHPSTLQLARDEIWQSWRYTCAENADHPRAKELFDGYKLLKGGTLILYPATYRLVYQDGN